MKQPATSPAGTPRSRQLQVTWRHAYMYVVVPVVALLLLSMYDIKTQLPPVAPAATTPRHQFSEERAMKHVREIMKLGGPTRLVGDIDHDVALRDYFLRQVKAIRKEYADIGESGLEVDVSVHHPSGGIIHDFIGMKFANAYTNLTNVAVRLRGRDPATQQRSFMVSAHYDSAIGGPGAGDDLLNIGSMIELLRAMHYTPKPLRNSIVFLFIGAEESLNQGAHGFITSHPWAETIQCFANLDSAGNGGPAVLFQASSSGLAQLYAETAPRPFASVMCQDLFATGVVPGDTDFRQFRQHGGIPGLDFAYFQGGFVYHTSRDTLDRVPQGSMQFVGENMLPMLQHIAARLPEDFLQYCDPSAPPAIYFNLPGSVIVVSLTTAIILASLALLSNIFMFRQAITHRRASENIVSGRVFLQRTLWSLFFVFISFVGSIVAPALFHSILNFLLHRPLAIFKHDLLMPFVSLPPSIFGMMFGQALLQRTFRGTQVTLHEMARAVSAAVTVTWTLLTWFGLAFNAGTALILSFLSMVPFLSLALSHLLEPLLGAFVVRVTGGDVVGLTRIAAHMIVCVLPMLPMLHFAAIMSLTITPITARMGAGVPGDVVLAALFGLLWFFILGAVLPIVHRFGAISKIMRTMAVVIVLSLVASSMVFPYAETAPKRVYLAASHFGDRSELVISELDFGRMKRLMTEEQWQASFRDARDVPDDHVGDVMETLFPFSHFFRGYSRPIPPVKAKPPNVVVTSDAFRDGVRRIGLRLEYDTLYTPWMTLRVIAPLKAWSVTSELPYTTRNPESHFLRHISGPGIHEYSLWIEALVPSADTKVKLLTTTVTDEPHNNDIKDVAAGLPDWIDGITLEQAIAYVEV